MTTAPSATLREIQANAALEEMDRQAAYRRHLDEVLDLGMGSRLRIEEIYRIGEDAVVSVAQRGSDEILWGAIVGDRRPLAYQYSQDEAIVHLVALRHGERSTQAHTYACRVLQVPTHE